MLDNPIPPIPDHVLEVRSRYSDLLEAVNRIAGTDVTPQQGLMIMTLGEAVIPATAMRKSRYYDGTNATYNLNLLEQRGYIVRHPVPGDRRRMNVALSDKGIALCIRLRRGVKIER